MKDGRSHALGIHRLWRRTCPTTTGAGCLPPSLVDYKSFPFIHPPHPYPIFLLKSSPSFRFRLIPGTGPQRKARCHSVLATGTWSNFKVQALQWISCDLLSALPLSLVLDALGWCSMPTLGMSARMSQHLHSHAITWKTVNTVCWMNLCTAFLFLNCGKIYTT